MNIYLLSQTVKNGNDTYDSAVVTAETIKQAINIHPSGSNKDFSDTYPSWCQPEDVKVKFIGTTDIIKTAQVICASFNAG